MKNIKLRIVYLILGSALLLCELYNSIWGNTGCESGICPL